MNKIAVLVNCRIEGNPNCGLLRLLESIASHSSNLQEIEVLIKFDTCDRNVPSMLRNIRKAPRYKYIIEPRGRGYIDIHHGYNRLLMHLDPRAEIIGAMGDDFTVRPGWDRALLEQYAPNSDEIDRFMIIHQRHHPPSDRFDFKSNPFYLNYPVFDKMENLYVVDEAPFWSRQLIFASTWLGGGLSFTDGWTLALEYCLWKNHQINITKFTDQQYIDRVVHPVVDTPKSPRWTGDRAKNFEYIRSSYFRSIIENQAENVALRILNRKLIDGY